MSSDMAERIANARKEAEYLKDKIREKKAALNDTSRKSTPHQTLEAVFRSSPKPFLMCIDIRLSKGPSVLACDMKTTTTVLLLPSPPPPPTLLPTPAPYLSCLRITPAGLPILLKKISPLPTTPLQTHDKGEATLLPIKTFRQRDYSGTSLSTTAMTKWWKTATTRWRQIIGLQFCLGRF